MLISAILAALKTAADAWAAEHGASVVIARDPFDPVQIMTSGGQGLVVVISYAGSSKTESSRERPLGQGDWEVIVGTRLALPADRAAGIYVAAGDRAPLADHLDSIIQAVADIEIDDATTGHKFAYAGDAPLIAPDGQRLAAFVAKFNLTRIVHT